MLFVEFRLLEKDTPNEGRKQSYRLLQQCAMDAVPAQGEMVNVLGDPVRVAVRQWAVRPDSEPQNLISAFVYIYVLPWGS